MSLLNDSPLIPSNVTWKDAVTINNSKETTENHQFSTVSLASAWCFALFYILFYNSFKIFPQFWLAKSTRIIHHKQLLMTKFGRILCLKRKWRQKCSLLQVNAPLTVKTWGRGWVVFVVKTKMADTLLVSIMAKNIAKTARRQLGGRHLLFGINLTSMQIGLSWLCF